MRELVEHDSDDDSTDTSKRVVGQTANGNSIYIVLKKNGRYGIKFFEGGVLPDALKGEYTSYDIAERTVKIHLAMVAAKKPKNSKTTPKV